MNFLEEFAFKILKYDSINKFRYKKSKNIPTLKKIVLNFNLKSTNLQNLASSLLALKLITKEKGLLTVSKKPNISLKIRKGNPVGCKIILKKTKALNFVIYLHNNVFYKLKTLYKFNNKKTKHSFFFSIIDIFNFEELENHYYLFSNLKKIDFGLVTSAKSNKELLFILQSFKFPITKSKYNSTVECNLAKIKVKGSNPFICFYYRISGRAV